MSDTPSCPKCGGELEYAYEENCEVEFYDCISCKEPFVVDIEIVRDWDTLRGSQDHD